MESKGDGECRHCKPKLPSKINDHELYYRSTIITKSKLICTLISVTTNPAVIIPDFWILQLLKPRFHRFKYDIIVLPLFTYWKILCSNIIRYLDHGSLSDNGNDVTSFYFRYF
ncbi:uncharacterized protein LOC117151824 [Bombus impatiens]|uniref:Uncharacterized protein LOC117151824 n=1 Tax=Bombus impatiens TaxID=132113 RepID=A0A6P8LRN6_BOMIM|nr:uncharacterized protein LOC117151824 [Bombus impatiens]